VGEASKLKMSSISGMRSIECGGTKQVIQKEENKSAKKLKASVFIRTTVQVIS
jgi:uncharacterized membrane protein